MKAVIPAEHSYPAGQKMQVVDRQTGEIQEVEVFVSIQGASQKTFAWAIASQKKADWI